MSSHATQSGSEVQSGLLTRSEIEHAQRSMSPEILHTPLLPFEGGSTVAQEARTYLKLENLQVTGSYKARAAFFLLRSLDSAARRAGVVMASAGNFGKAFAYAGARLHVPVAIVCPAHISRYRIDTIAALGATVILAPSYEALPQTVADVAAARGMIAIDHPRDRRVALGHSTVGSEILELTGLRTVVVPVSSGGLIAGVASAVKFHDPAIRVVGVQPTAAAAMYASWKAGRPVSIPTAASIADALSATSVAPIALAHVQERVDEIVLVDDADIQKAMWHLAVHARLIVEAAGAVALAALLTGRVRAAGATAAIVTGGNIDLLRWCALAANGLGA